MALNDIFEVTVRWFNITAGQNGLWVHNMVCTDEGTGNGDAITLATVRRNSINGLFGGLTNPAWLPVDVDVQNLTNPDDFFTIALTYTPTGGGDPMPSHDAVGFRSPRQGQGKNRSRCNLPLLGKDNLDDAGRWSESSLEALEPVASFLGSSQIAITTGELWVPVTIRKNYMDGFFLGAEVRSIVTGLWQINKNVTTVKSRQLYDWTNID